MIAIGSFVGNPNKPLFSCMYIAQCMVNWLQFVFAVPHNFDAIKRLNSTLIEAIETDICVTLPQKRLILPNQK